MFEFDTESGEIYLYDDIGPEWLGMIDAGAVRGALAEMGDKKRVTVRINSPGGAVDEGVAIYNMLARHPGGVDTVVDSLAASMASYIFLAGRNRTVAKNSRVMMHNPWTIAIGNATEIRSVADVLDKYSRSLVPDYAAATGRGEDEIQEALEAETWFTADESVAYGLAHRIEGTAVEAVAVKEGRFRNTPKDLLTRPVAGQRTPYPVQRERARVLVR